MIGQILLGKGKGTFAGILEITMLTEPPQPKLIPENLLTKQIILAVTKIKLH